MAVVTSRTSVTDVAVRVSLPELPRVPARTSVLVTSMGPDPVFLGGSGVTTTDGYEVAASGATALEVAAGDELFAVCATLGSATVATLVSA